MHAACYSCRSVVSVCVAVCCYLGDVEVGWCAVGCCQGVASILPACAYKQKLPAYLCACCCLGGCASVEGAVQCAAGALSGYINL